MCVVCDRSRITVWQNKNTLFVVIWQVKQMQEHISSFQLSRCVGCHVDLSMADKLAMASSLLQYYDHGHSFNRDILHTEFA